MMSLPFVGIFVDDHTRILIGIRAWFLNGIIIDSRSQRFRYDSSVRLAPSRKMYVFSGEHELPHVLLITLWPLFLLGERSRWTEASQQFSEQINRLVGDVLLATGFLSYTGPFNQDFRNLLARLWRKELEQNNIPFSEVLMRSTRNNFYSIWSLWYFDFLFHVHTSHFDTHLSVVLH